MWGFRVLAIPSVPRVRASGCQAPDFPCYRLRGFSPQETAAYIRHHLKLAGVDQELFTARALDHIHRACNGLPRPINQLAHLCLMAAAARQERLVDHEPVEAVIAAEWQAPPAAGR